MKKLIKLAIVAACALAMNAYATVLDFESAPSSVVLPAEFAIDGVTFQVHSWVEGTIALGRGNGTQTLAFCGFDNLDCWAGTKLTLSTDSLFSVTAIDALTWYGGGTLNFVGHLADGNTVDASFSVDTSSKSLALAGLTGLSSLDIFWTGAYAGEIDNLALAAFVPEPPTGDVPEPATLSLIGAALLGLGVARRRKA